MILLVGWVSLMLISFDLTLRLCTVGGFTRAGHSWDTGGAGLLFQSQRLPCSSIAKGWGQKVKASEALTPK